MIALEPKTLALGPNFCQEGAVALSGLPLALSLYPAALADLSHAFLVLKII